MAKDGYLQALRGLAIAAVVLIHCLSQCAASIAVRPFLNFSVALFLFLAGGLTDGAVRLRGGSRRACGPRQRRPLPGLRAGSARGGGPYDAASALVAQMWLIGRASAASPERTRGLPKADGSLKQDGSRASSATWPTRFWATADTACPTRRANGGRSRDVICGGRFSMLAEKAALLRETRPIGYAYDGGEGDLALLADLVRLVAGFNGLVVKARYLRALTTAAMASRLGARLPSFSRGKTCSRSPASSCTSSCRSSCSSSIASLSNTRGGCTR